MIDINPFNVKVILFLCKRYSVCPYCGKIINGYLHPILLHCRDCSSKFKRFKKQQNVSDLIELYSRRWDRLNRQHIILFIDTALTELMKAPLEEKLTSSYLRTNIYTEINEYQQYLHDEWIEAENLKLFITQGN